MDCKVAALNVSPLDTHKYPPEVEWKIDQSNKSDLINLAQVCNDDAQITGVIIQHEYGIFGGKDGEYILDFVKRLKNK